MTVNLLHERADVDHFSNLIDRVAPDVVVAQELGPLCADVLADRYPAHQLDPANDFTGRGMATRFNARFGDIPMPVREGTWAFLEVNGRILRVVGMHLVNPILALPWRSVRQRTDQLEALFAWTSSADDDVPLVVAGDMNASPAWPAYKKLRQRWDDLVVLQAEKSGAAAERTWGWRPGWPRLLRIDHVFGQRVTATSVAVEPVRGSDHHAVIVDLDLTS